MRKRTHAAFARGNDRAARSPGLGVEHRAGAARLRLDQRAGERRADLLVAREEANERRRRAAEFRERGEHERVHHEARLHVGHARPIGACALGTERPARDLALRKYRVAMSHQQDGGVRARADARAKRIAETRIRDDLGSNAVALEKFSQSCADRIDAVLVVAAAVGVHELFEQRQHGRPLRGKPLENAAFLRGHVRHGVSRSLPGSTGNPCRPSKRNSRMGARVKPAHDE
jgi:hypothetical protein